MSNVGTKVAYLNIFFVCINCIIYNIFIVYQMVSLSPQQCIRVLILLHGVGSEILCCRYVYVFGIVSTVFFSFFSSLCFLHTVANKGTSLAYSPTLMNTTRLKNDSNKTINAYKYSIIVSRV